MSHRSALRSGCSTISGEEDENAAKTQRRKVADELRPTFPKRAGFMDDAECDVLADASVPKDHWTKIQSITCIERLNGEIKRLVGAILLEQNDKWAVQRGRYMTLETIAALSDDPIVKLPAVAA
jgi:putative transposase